MRMANLAVLWFVLWGCDVVKFSPLTARNFVASTWFDTRGLSKKESLVAKCRELVSGDRAEIMCDAHDNGNLLLAESFTKRSLAELTSRGSE